MPTGLPSSPRAPVDYSTRDLDRSRAFLRPFVVGDELTVTGEPADFRFRVTSAPLDAFHVETLEHSLTGDALLKPRGAVLVAHLLRGQLEFDRPEGPIRMQRGQSYLYQAHLPIRIRWTDLRVGMISLDLTQVERVAAELTGVDSAELRFHDGHPVSTAAERYWQSVVRLVNRDVMTSELTAHSPLVQASVARLLIVALLQTFPNTTMTEPYVRSEDGHVPPSAMRRAVAYIDANADRPITMDDIAAAARVTPRSLQHSFRRVWDTTPTAYLRRVRLERAHRDLQVGDPTNGDTVAGIAARWGFGHVGRFASRYREAYGQAPHDVLRT